MIATFISTSTSPAAGSGRSRLNASITAHTANSCISQPTHWNSGGAERRQRPPQDGEPLPGHDHERPQAPHAVVHAALAGAGEEEADHQQDEADEPEDDEARDRPVRDLRRQQDPGDEDARPGRGRTGGARRRCRAGSRSSLGRAAGAVAARRRGRTRRPAPAARRSRAARSRRPRRPGRSAGCGSGSAWSIVSRQESERASTERRLRRMPTITQRQATTSNAW